MLYSEKVFEISTGLLLCGEEIEAIRTRAERQSCSNEGLVLVSLEGRHTLHFLQYKAPFLSGEPITKFLSGSLKERLLLVSEEEISAADFIEKLQDAENNGILKFDNVWKTMDFPLIPGIEEMFGDYYIADQDSESRDDLLMDARGCSMPQLADEINRIFEGKSVAQNADGAEVFPGHPVCYGIVAKDDDTIFRSEYALLSALRKAGRLQSKIVYAIELDKCSIYLSHFYRMFDGAAVIVRFEGSSLHSDKDLTCCRIVGTGFAEKHRRSTLTIFTATMEAQGEIDRLRFESWPMVKIAEENMVSNFQHLVIDDCCRKYGVTNPPQGLYEGLPDLPEGECGKEDAIRRYFRKWYSQYLCTAVFPLYENVVNESEKKAEEPPAETKKADGGRPSALEELDSMIGLAELKKTVHQMVDLAKMQKLRKERGFPINSDGFHMTLEGNPGTGKTACARLIGKILFEEGLLPNDKFVECGRGDLIGKHIGWTAPMVQEKFEEARGGVIFVDEAYSLVDDRDGFSSECIATIVQEMENHRDDTVVIFAGYSDKMEEFVNFNPGLKSRIAYRIKFPDYSKEELLQIADFFLKKRGLKVTTDGTDALQDKINIAYRKNYGGNARYVRNLLHKALMAQASRLVLIRPEEITDEMLNEISAEDFPDDSDGEACNEKGKGSEKKIGFIL